MRMSQLMFAAPAALILGFSMPSAPADAAGATGAKTGSPAAQQSNPSGQQQAATAGARQQDRNQAVQGQPLLVADAQGLLNKTLKDADGKDAGRITYMMIDPEDGDVLFAVVTSSDTMDLGDQFVAVPWDSIDVAGWRSGGGQSQTIDFKASRDAIEQAPRYGVDDLIRLTTPKVQSETFALFATPASGQAQGQQGQQQGQQQQDQGQGQAYALVGDGAVHTMVAPPLTLDNKLLGSDVYTAQGNRFGQVDRLILDVEDGRVAYALINTDSYLGMGGQWSAVPIQALDWSGEGRYMLSEEAGRQIQAQPPIEPNASLPTQVPRGDMADLYERFGVDPYWQQG